ncbi:MAG: hypothetical protein RIT27_1820 [Pseudomonadota bacterium]|jgi:xanthine dehydrogenase accessory factor
MKDFFKVVTELQNKPEPFAIATVVKIVGSSSAKPAAKAIINQVGDVVYGWVGGGCAEALIREEALKCLAKETTALIDVQMKAEKLEEGMACGGEMQVFIEPIIPQPTLWIFGHNRLAQVLCEFAVTLGFNVNIFDQEADQAFFSCATKVLNGRLEDCLSQMKNIDYVVIATLHINDSQLLKAILSTTVHHIAVIASRKRAALLLETCDKKTLPRIYAPAGLDLGAQTPEEIALSVLSEIVLCRRKGTGQMLRK